MSSDVVGAVRGERSERLGLWPKLRFPEFADRPLHHTTLGKVTQESTTRNTGKLAADYIMGVSKEDGIVPMQPHLIADNVSRYKVIRKDWFAYNPMRLNIGSIARWHGENDRLVSPDYVVFQCSERRNEPSLLPSYLDHFRRSKQWVEFTNEAGDGGVRKRIYYNDIAQLRLLLPDNDEQQKVAECLSSLDAVIAAEGERLAALRDQKKGLMQALFPAQGQSTPRLRFPEFRDAGEWEQTSLQKALAGPATYGIVKAGDYQATGVRMVRGGDIKGSVINKDLPLVADAVHREYRRTILRTNDVLIALVGYPGEAAVVPEELAGSNVSRAVGLLRPSERVVPDFLASYLNSDKGRRDVLAPSAGSAQVVVNLAALNNLRLLLPQPAEQRRIAALLAALDIAMIEQVNRLASLKSHKSGLMQQLFPSPAQASV